MEGAGRGGFVRQTKLDHTLSVSIAISILPEDGRLEGLSIWWREETSMRAGGWLESHHSAAVRDLGKSMALWLARTMRSTATIGQRVGVAGAEDGYILGRHTRPGGA